MSFTFIAPLRSNKPKRNVNIITAGARSFGFAIQKNGKVWGWGYQGTQNTLGNNSSIDQYTPVSLYGPAKTFCQISSGNGFTFAIDKYGRAWAWGNNANGRLGINIAGTGLFSTPVSLAGAVKTFCKIFAAGNAGHAIDQYGRAWGWGTNESGQIGNNSTLCRATPVSVLGAVKTFCDIQGGGGRFNNAIALDKYGMVWGWGNNGAGQLGDNSVTPRRTPVSVAGAKKTFCKISGGMSSSNFSYAIDKYGQVWSWGFNSAGQLGDNSIISKRTPVSLGGAKKTFCEIDAGGNFGLAIDKYGMVWGWGYNRYGQIGNNSDTLSLTPVRLAGETKTFCKIQAGASFALGVDKNSRAWAWGYREDGALGYNLKAFTFTPIKVCGVKKTFCEIGTGSYVCSIIDQYGQVWGWGNNNFGQLGDNSTISKRTPVSLGGAKKTFCRINQHTFSNGMGFAIDQYGQVWGWGFNGASGQLGDNSTISKRTPVSLSGEKKTFCKINGGGGDFAGAMDKYGQVWSWGFNSGGQLGDNSTISKRTPVSLGGAKKTFCEIGLSATQCLAIDKYGRVWGWGANNFGGVGNNTTVVALTPVSVQGQIKTFCKIISANHSLAIDKYGQVWGWGLNSNGVLGDNSIISKRTPVSVGGAKKTFCEISASTQTSFAIDQYGQVWGWGNNNVNQITDINNAQFVMTPFKILGSARTFCKIGSSGVHSVAIDKYGEVWAWGYMALGALGNNQDNFETTPVRVCTI